MQGTQATKSHANTKNESFWFKAKLVSQFLTFSFLLTQPFFLPYLHAAPVGGNVVGGSGSIRQEALHTTINQTSQNLAINWQSFDVNTNEHVHFVQPNSSSVALNRILGNNGSVIQGQIDANGQVILVNPNGVFFTSTATVNVGGLIASSLDMTPADFMNGNYMFNEVAGTNGSVINSGLINASTGGNVALIGKQVKNEGLISAKLGSIILAAGKQSVLTFDNQGLIGVKVTKEVLQSEIGLDEAVINSGEINAAGGRVLLTASTSQDVFSQAVNTNSLDQATSVVVNADGSFTLGNGADVLNTGSINVSSDSNKNNSARIILLGENITSSGSIKANVENGKAGEIELHAKNKTLLTKNSITSAKALSSGQGGLIKILGDKVGLFDNAFVDASGVNGGGEVLIGGDQEGRNLQIRNANYIYLGKNTSVKADATDLGDGGKIIAFSEDSARIHGKLYARGGLKKGNGGFIETSGLRGFKLTSVPDASAYVGNNGTWLIDPYNITITGNTNNAVDNDGGNFSYFDAIATGAEIDVDNIKSGLQNGDVIIRTTRSDGNTPVGGENGDILIRDNIDFDGVNNNKATLTLKADGDITLRAGNRIYDSNTGDGDQLNVNLYAKGDIVLNSNSSIFTQGGALNIGVGNFVDGSLPAENFIPTSFTNKGLIDTTGGNNQAGGNITVITSGFIDIQSTAELKANGGTATSSRSRGNPGQDGGAISLSAGDTITISATNAISTVGSDANHNGTTGDGIGGKGGSVTINTTSNNINITSNIITKGGNGDGGNGNGETSTGGAGGSINITADAGTVSVAGINTTGGAGTGNNSNSNGGNAGSITLAAVSNVTLNNNLTANGGTKGTNGTDGTANTITLNGNTIVNTSALTVTATGSTNGDISFNGTTSVASGKDRQDNLSVVGKDITFAGDVGSTTNRFKGVLIASNGVVKAETSAAVVDRTDLFVDTLSVTQSSSFTARNIDASAATNTSTSRIGATSNTVNIKSSTAIRVADISTAANGVTGAGAGQSGGGILLTAEDITVGELNSSGSDATSVVANGGDAGVITLSATDNAANGTPTITLNGDLNSQGGALAAGSTSGSAGASNNVKLSINSTQSNAVGTVTVGAYTGNFTSLVDVTGSAGTDTLVASDRINEWVVTAANTATLNTQLTFTNFEEITGSSSLTTDTLTARNVNNSWLVDGTNSGRLTNTDVTTENLVFRNINNLTGNAGVDDFDIASGGNLTGTIDGGSASLNNSLVINTSLDNTWTIDSANVGTVSLSTKLGNGFSNIQKIKGGSGDDTFNFGVNGSVDLVEGGGDNSGNTTSPTIGDIVNFTSKTGGVDVVLGTASTTDFNVDSIEQINASSSAVKNTLTGKNQDNTWNITKGDGGDVEGTVSFNNFTDLNGGSANDTFIVAANGSLSGTIDGKGQTAGTAGDELDLSSKTNIKLNIGALSSVTYGTNESISYTDIELITGNGSDSTVVGEDVASTWTITGQNAGWVSKIANGSPKTYFTGFNNLTGGTADDGFYFDAAGSITGVVDGTSGINDFVSMTAATSAVAFTLSATPNANATNLANIDNVTGDYVNNTTMAYVTLIGADTTNAWNITGINDGNINNSAVTFTNVSNITGGSGNDTFTFSAGSISSIDITGLIDGGSGGIDKVDMSAITSNISVDIGSDITRIDEVIGNNKSTATTKLANPAAELIGADYDSTWTISNVNSGTIVYNDSIGVNPDLIIAFSGFNTLQGKDNVVDTFSFSKTGNINGDITGGIDGGAGVDGLGNNIIDTVDYSAILNKQIDVGNATSGITDIEQVKGDGSTTVLKGVLNSTNMWSLTSGVNRGNVNYSIGQNQTANLLFVNINKLQAGDAGDTFTINGGQLRGTITGGAGADTVNLTLSGNETGTLIYDAGTNGTGTDSLTIMGDNSAAVGDGSGYSGIYSINVNNRDQFSYTNQGNTFNIEYSAVETVNDDLTGTTLKVNGTSDNDTITLGNGTFQVSSTNALSQIYTAQTVNYTNKTNFSVDGLDGINATDSDNIIISEPLSISGNFTFKAETLTLPDTTTYTGDLITAKGLYLDSISSIVASVTNQSNVLNTNVDNIGITNSGAINILEADAIDINTLSTSGAVYITNTIGNITSTSDLVSNNVFSLTAQNGDISISGSNNKLTGLISLNTSAANDALLNNTTFTYLNNISTRDLTVNAIGSSARIYQNSFSGKIISRNARFTSTGYISLSSGANNFTTVNAVSLDNIYIRDVDSIGLNTLSGNIVSVTSGGSITDANGNSPGDNVTGTTLKLRASTGIGTGNALETNVSNIDAVTTSGNINIDNVRNVTLTNLEVSNSGNITFNNTGNVEIVKVDAGFGVSGAPPIAPAGGGKFTMTVTQGSVTGSARDNYRSVADITAYDTDILVPSGTFGNAGRPISIRVNNEFKLFSLSSAVFPIGEPYINSDSSTAKIAITDAFSNLAGQQLIEVESIGDIDPAIFTDVRNYSHSDIALMMPSDQRYDVPDDDEEYDKKAKQKREKFLKSN